MAINQKYKSRIPSCKYIFLNGKEAAFLQGVFVTGVSSEITQLDEEVALGHPTIYRDENDMTVDTEALSPMELIRAQAREEAIKVVRAEMAAATNPSNDRGNSDQGDVGASFANTANIAEGAGDSTSSEGTAIPAVSTPASSAPSLLSQMKSKVAASAGPVTGV